MPSYPSVGKKTSSNEAMAFPDVYAMQNSQHNNTGAFLYLIQDMVRHYFCHFLLLISMLHPLQNCTWQLASNPHSQGHAVRFIAQLRILTGHTGQCD